MSDLFLSQLVLNPSNPRALKDLSNAHALHQRIMHGFPDEASRQQPRTDWNILYRQEPYSDVARILADSPNDAAGVIVLVQSTQKPNWNTLPPGYLQRQTTPKALPNLLDQLVAGRTLQFRLRANPSKRDKASRKTVALTGDTDRLDWLKRKASQHGFDLGPVELTPSPDIWGRKKKGGPPIKLVSALYQGILQIADPDRFKLALLQGIGRGRSYGCGLLSLAPC